MLKSTTRFFNEGWPLYNSYGSKVMSFNIKWLYVSNRVGNQI